MSTLVVETIKHTNDTTLLASDTSGQLTVQGENTATTNLQQGLCKVWYNISSDFATTNDSFNITSITDNATGEHNGNFTNNMTGASYGALADHHNNNASGAGLRFGQVHDTASDGVRVHTGKNTGTTNFTFEEDGVYTEPVCHVMGDLA